MATANKDIDFSVEQSTNGILWFTENSFPVETNTFQGDIIAVPGLVAGTHVRIEGQSAVAGGVDVTAILGCELVDN